MRRVVFLLLLASSLTFASPAKKGYSNSPSKSSQSEDSEEFVDISDAPVRNAEAAASPLLPLKKDVDYNLNPRPLFCFQSYERPDKPCVPDQAVSCISTSIRKTNDSEAAFFARCSSQTCDEFEQDLKSELVKTPGTEINYTCCSTPACNALPYGKGFQMTSSNLEAKSVKFPLNGDPDGEMSFVARHQPREEEQLMNYRRTPLTCLYTGPFGALYPVVCKLEDATSCVSFTNYYRDGTKRFTATCSRFSCDQFEKAIKIELGRGHLKHIDFKCCKDNNCNRHSDAFRLSVPEITIGEAVALPAASHKDGPPIIPPTPVRTSLGGGGYVRPIALPVKQDAAMFRFALLLNVFVTASLSDRDTAADEYVDISASPVSIVEVAASPLLPLEKDPDYNYNARPLFCVQSHAPLQKQCFRDQSTSCISTSIRKGNDSTSTFFARCSAQSCDYFKQELKAELEKSTGVEVNYTCCDSPGYGKGFQMTSSNLEANPIKFPLNGDPDGESSALAVHSPTREEKLTKFRRIPRTCLYTGPFGVVYPVVCKFADASSCVAFTTYYRDGTKRLTATCSRFPCVKFEKAVKIELGRGHLKQIDFKCCKENNCNAHSDGFRLTVPELTVSEPVALSIANAKGPAIIPRIPVQASPLESEKP